MDNYIAHIGRPHEGWTPHSGRYAYGTGAKWDKKHREWLALADERQQHFTEHPEECIDKKTGKPVSVKVALAQSFDMSTGTYQNVRKMHVEGKRAEDIRRCVSMYDGGNGMSISQISDATGLKWSTIKNYLKPGAIHAAERTTNIASALETLINEGKYVDVSPGVEFQLGISETQLSAAVEYLKSLGYAKEEIHVPQATNPDLKPAVMVLAEPGTTKRELWANREKISSPDGIWFENDGEILKVREAPVSIDSSRLRVKYAEDEGDKKDGVIEIRPGLEDLNLGDRPYAQVRIAVDGTHYLKGMAIYNAHLPDGVDILFNTSKHNNVPIKGEGDMTVLKPLKKNFLDKSQIDISNPFGSATRQWNYTDSNGVEHQSPVEIVNDDESWDKWKRSLSPQILSKQPIELARKQLALAYENKEREYNDILKVDNPTFKRQLLAEFADSCDSDAVDLKAAPVHDQTTNVILPISSLKDDEIYAPYYENGQELYLFRFPHAGKFEIAKCRVNNDNPEGKEVLGTTPWKAVGINANVAARLSGADFDGDTTLIIPASSANIQTQKPLEDLVNFNHLDIYHKQPNQVKTGDKKDGGDGFRKQQEMGKITNLITDMTAMNASEDEIARAVKYSMVVIDAEKHNLDWRRCKEDCKITELYQKYQGKKGGGGVTIMTRSRSRIDIPEREEIRYPSQMTPEEKERWDRGEKIYRETGRLNKNGKLVKEKTDRMSIEKDARNLIKKGYDIEYVYADHANKLKELALISRAESRRIGPTKENTEARKVYPAEYESLKKKYADTMLNKPRERQAQLIASKNIERLKQANPRFRDYQDKEAQDKLKKFRNREIQAARKKVGAERVKVELTPKEWEAINAGVFSDTKLSVLLQHANKNKVMDLATGRTAVGVNEAKLSRARTLQKQGKTWDEIANELDVSKSTLQKALNKKD